MRILLASIIFVLGGISVASSAPKLNVKVVNDFSIQVAGTYTLSPKPIVIKKQVIAVDSPTFVKERNEEYAGLPGYNPAGAFWNQGGRFRSIDNTMTGAKGTLVADSVVVKGDKEGKKIFVKDKDYGVAAEWGFFGRLAEGSSIDPAQTVYVDYDHYLFRIDTVAVNSLGKLVYYKGEPAIQLPVPPTLPKKTYPVVNIFTRKAATQLTDENLYVISELKFPQPKGASVASKLLPKTWAKIQNHEPLKILAWGDSVTAGGSVTDYDTFVWQKVFYKDLCAKFPDAKITLDTTAWGGRGTASFLQTPIGQEFNIKEHVLDKKPDLVVMEFVNDTYPGGDPVGTGANYKQIKDMFDAQGIEWIIMTPAFTWFDSNTYGEKYKASDRWYDKFAKEFAAANKGVAVADASIRWEHLQYQGIPFCTLNVNGINHPNNAGHKLLADSVTCLF